MIGHALQLQDSCAQIFFARFHEWYGHNFSWEPPSPMAEEMYAPIDATDGHYRLMLFFDRLDEAGIESGGAERLWRLEERLSEAVVKAILVWVPPGGVIPTEESEVSAFVTRIEQVTNSLQPGGRAEVRLPVSLQLTKLRDEGAYVSVIGGLSSYWARISEFVHGAYHLDSTEMKRPPPGVAWREALFERIGREAAALAVGQETVLATEQAWTVQQVPRGDRVVLVAAPEGFDPMDGINVRRLLRRRVIAANERCGERGADLQGLLLVGIYRYMEEEPVTAALRGFDPAIYRHLDFVALIADGEVKLVLPPRGLPWR